MDDVKTVLKIILLLLFLMIINFVLGYINSTDKVSHMIVELQRFPWKAEHRYGHYKEFFVFRYAHRERERIYTKAYDVDTGVVHNIGLNMAYIITKGNLIIIILLMSLI